MSSCVMPVPPVTLPPIHRLLKRPREEPLRIGRLCKAPKHTLLDAPHSYPAVILEVPSLETDPVATTASVPVAWPTITTSENLQNAMGFIQESRHHALGLMAQNEWHRAISVLDKVERANEIVARQRRSEVLRQANASQAIHDDDESRPRKVCFCDEVLVAPAGDADRRPAKVPGFMREEMLVLRASRVIPATNLSEFWN